MNRGSDLFNLAFPNEPFASMRPRFMNRGSRKVSPSLSGVNVRFNEAPIHESGKSARRCVPRCLGSCFNEAPIHESGKSQRAAVVAGVGRLSFNEAPIHESGKCWWSGRRRTEDRCFNEAPIHESGKCNATS